MWLTICSHSARVIGPLAPTEFPEPAALPAPLPPPAPSSGFWVPPQPSAINEAASRRTWIMPPLYRDDRAGAYSVRRDPLAGPRQGGVVRRARLAERRPRRHRDRRTRRCQRIGPTREPPRRLGAGFGRRRDRAGPDDRLEPERPGLILDRQLGIGITVVRVARCEPGRRSPCGGGGAAWVCVVSSRTAVRVVWSPTSSGCR
jgi:hypothetical protein